MNTSTLVIYIGLNVKMLVCGSGLAIRINQVIWHLMQFPQSFNWIRDQIPIFFSYVGFPF